MWQGVDGGGGYKRDIVKSKIEQKTSINSFRMWTQNELKDYDIQLNYIEWGGEIALDFIGRYETLKEDYKYICEKLNLPVDELPFKKSGFRDKKYYTEFDLVGSSNYAFNLILLKPNKRLARNLMNKLNEEKIEFRRGSSGGGNQLRQPYLKGIVRKDAYKKVPITDHIHFYGFYIGNYPSLTKRKILQICKIINSVN